MARMKKEDPFYTKLKDFAAAIEECAVDYEKLIRGYPETEIMIPQMKLHESECDQRVQAIMKELGPRYGFVIGKETGRKEEKTPDLILRFNPDAGNRALQMEAITRG